MTARASCADMSPQSVPIRTHVSTSPSHHHPAPPHTHTLQVSSQVNLSGLGGKDSSNGAAGLAGQGGSTASMSGMYAGVRGTPYLSKVESIASSAVRAADKVCACMCEVCMCVWVWGGMRFCCIVLCCVNACCAQNTDAMNTQAAQHAYTTQALYCHQ
jgi:hypothetical protein